MRTVTITINDSTAEWLHTSCLLDFPPPAAEVLCAVRDALPVHCRRCDGCGQIANSTDGDTRLMADDALAPEQGDDRG